MRYKLKHWLRAESRRSWWEKALWDYCLDRGLGDTVKVVAHGTNRFKRYANRVPHSLWAHCGKELNRRRLTYEALRERIAVIHANLALLGEL